MSARYLRHVFIAFALLCAQQAAQWHALSHFEHDLAVAERGEKNAPPVGHAAEQCLAFHAIDSALPNLALALEPQCVKLPAVAHFILSLPFSPRIAFDARAPPLFS